MYIEIQDGETVIYEVSFLNGPAKGKPVHGLIHLLPLNEAKAISNEFAMYSDHCPNCENNTHFELWMRKWLNTSTGFAKNARGSEENFGKLKALLQHLSYNCRKDI